MDSLHELAADSRSHDIQTTAPCRAYAANERNAAYRNGIADIHKNTYAQMYQRPTANVIDRRSRFERVNNYNHNYQYSNYVPQSYNNFNRHESYPNFNRNRHRYFPKDSTHQPANNFRRNNFSGELQSNMEPLSWRKRSNNADQQYQSTKPNSNGGNFQQRNDK